MEEMTKHGVVGLAAMRAGVDRKTARKYVKGGKLPSELVGPRDWRTHEDAFVEHWPELEALLVASPALEAKTLFEVLVEKYPGRYEEGQLWTLQRRMKAWRAERGPDKEVVLAQRHRPGEAAQTDFTWATELAVTIAGQLFVHMLCVFVLPYSNWRWASVCLSESIAAIRPRRPARPLSTRACARVASNRQLHRGDASNPRRQDRRRRGQRQAAVQRGLPRDHAALRDEAAHAPRSARRSKTEMSKRPTARSNALWSRRSWCAAAATSRAPVRGSRSSTTSCARVTGRAAFASPRTWGPCASSTSRGCPNSWKSACASASGARCG